MSNYQSPASKLRQLLSQDSIVTAVGVYDGISARVAINCGAQVLYQTGAGSSASALGRADLGFLSMSDMVREAGLSAQIASSGKEIVPVIADADVGFGGAPQVARTIQEYHRNGIAALHIEDQVASKRCGHLDSKQLVGVDIFVQRIKAASYAISKLPCPPEDRIMLIARTDALATDGYEAAISRLEAARRNGADIGFLEGITKDSEASAVTSHFAPWPILVNCITGGKTPLWRRKDAQALGFKLAIFPTAGIFPALYALRASYKNLLDEDGIGIEAESGEKSKVDLGGADPKGLRNFFVEMGLEDEVEIDRIAADGKGLGAP